jgi:hypothetical protein
MAEEPREWEREWLTIPQSHSGSEICTQDVIPVAETVTLEMLFPKYGRGAARMGKGMVDHPPVSLRI